jgi:hypothetical protein
MYVNKSYNFCLVEKYLLNTCQEWLVRNINNIRYNHTLPARVDKLQFSYYPYLFFLWPVYVASLNLKHQTLQVFIIRHGVSHSMHYRLVYSSLVIRVLLVGTLSIWYRQWPWPQRNVFFDAGLRLWSLVIKLSPIYRKPVIQTR